MGRLMSEDPKLKRQNFKAFHLHGQGTQKRSEQTKSILKIYAVDPRPLKGAVCRKQKLAVVQIVSQGTNRGSLLILPPLVEKFCLAKLSKPTREAFLESEDNGSAYIEYSGAAADSQEIPFSLVSVDDTSSIHTKIGSEERWRKEDDSYNGED